MIIDQITRPTLVIDLDKVEKNLDYMLQKAENQNVKFVPHFKTHQSKVIGELYRRKGVDAITVSSVKMAQYFAKYGWTDITIAFPINTLEIAALNDLIEAGIQLTFLINHLEVVQVLEDQLLGEVDAFIEIDAGYGRSGVPASDSFLVQEISLAIKDSKFLKLKGLYSHPGDTYACSSVKDIQDLWFNAREKVIGLKEQVFSQDDEVLVRMGDTPGCSIVENFAGVDEIGPGNFIFYDLVMNYLNVCDESDIAVALAAPVVSKSVERQEIIIHGGAVHLSKDHLFDENEKKFFGEMVVFTEEGWSPIIADVKLKSVSQEHGILSVSEEIFNKIELGDIVGILPIHSCLTANLMKEYLTLGGERIMHLEKEF